MSLLFCYLFLGKGELEGELNSLVFLLHALGFGGGQVKSHYGGGGNPLFLKKDEEE